MSDSLSVQNKEGKVRAKPSFLGKITARLPYGTKVKKLKEKSTWIKVEHEQTSGWLHKDVLTEKEIIVKAGKEDVERAASDDELVLAGKGFSEDVEKSYRQKNPTLNFAPVDTMEKFTVSEESLAKFLEDGGLANG